MSQGSCESSRGAVSQSGAVSQGDCELEGLGVSGLGVGGLGVRGLGVREYFY